MEKALGLCLAGYTVSWGPPQGSDHGHPHSAYQKPMIRRGVIIWCGQSWSVKQNLLAVIKSVCTLCRFTLTACTWSGVSWIYTLVEKVWEIITATFVWKQTLLLKFKSRSNGAALRPTVSPVLTSSAIANLRQYCHPSWESSMYAAFNQREEDDNNFHFTTFVTPWENQIQAPVKSFSLSRYAPPGLRPSENRINNYEEGIVRL